MPIQMNARAAVRETCRFRQAILVVALASCVVGCERNAAMSGADYFKKEDYASAVIEFKNAVQAQPGSVEARIALADALERTFDLVGTEQHLRKAVEAGGDADVLVPRIALVMLDLNETAKVINDFKGKQLKSAEADSDLRAAVAVAYVGQKQFALAQKQLDAAATKTAATMLAKAQLLLAQDKKAEALAALDTSLAGPHAPWWVLRGLGRVYESNGQREPALQFMARAYNAVPWHRAVTGEYGEFLVAAGTLEQAMVVRDKLKKTAPNYYWTHYLDALVLARQERSEASQAAALKVLSAAPGHLPANLLVASAELQKGDLLMASKRLIKIAPDYPYSVPLLQLLAETQLRLGKPGDAVNTIKRGLGVAPQNARLLSLRAESEVARGATKEAAATLEALRTSDPRNASYLLRLGALRAGAGDKAGAQKALDEAVEVGKNNPAIRDRIIAISLGMGDTGRVRQLADYAMKSNPQDPQSHLTQAAALDIQKDKAGAWRETLAALDLQAAFQPALSALGMQAKTPAQHAELLARYEKAVQSKPTSAQTYLECVRLLQQAKKDPARSIALLESGVAALPGATALRQALVQAHIRAGKPDTALSVAQAGASATNASPDATALLAAAYAQLGNPSMAAETYRNLAANYPQRAEWRLKLAELDAGAGRTKQATTQLRSLTVDRPFDPIPYITLAQLTWPDNLPEALSIAKELGEKESYKLTGMLLEGDLLVLAGKSDEALKQFAKAAKAGAVPVALLRSIQVLDRSQQSQSADQEMASSLRKFPEDASVVGFAAQRARAQGKPALAVEYLQKIVQKDPRNAIVLNDLAWAQVEAKLPDALKNATRASELAPDSPEVLDTLGMAQAQAGKQAEAIETLRVVINLVPKVAAPRLHLAELYANAGNPKEAARVLQPLDPKTLSAKEQASFARLGGKFGT